MTGLERFVEAQSGGVHEAALDELRAGVKCSHWMWFVFPQIAGLGRSCTAQFYAIADAREARAYLAHAILGPRLVEATEAVTLWAGARSLETIFGSVDAMKFVSSMTLFEAVSDRLSAFTAALDACASGRRDRATLERL